MKKSIIWIILAAAFLISQLSVILPFLWISPFRPQTADVLHNSYQLRHAAPIITVVCALFVVALVISLWRRIRLLGKVIASLMVGFTLLTAWFARQDYFEWFFHPLMHPGYTSAGKVNFLAGSDMVLAIRMNHDAVAYPLRLMAYHHVVNDVVGGTPVVATY